MHDAAALALEVHSSRDGAPPRRARDPRMRIQACGLAVRMWQKLEQSLRAMAAEERAGRFGSVAGSDMISFICCKGTPPQLSALLMGSPGPSELVQMVLTVL